MREYRGYSKIWGWIYGWFTDCNGISRINSVDGLNSPVIRESIGQFIGKKDINCRKIYHGDKVLIVTNSATFEMIVDEENFWEIFGYMKMGATVEIKGNLWEDGNKLSNY